MLRTETIERTTFDLLNSLMQDEKLNQFDLVGGTALALYLGHRKSVDIDLFSYQTFDVDDLATHLNRNYGFIQTNNPMSKLILIGKVNDIKVDFIWNDSLQIKPVRTCQGVRLASIYDLAAMKLKAILQTGTRLKDYVDVAFLSTKMSFNAMLDIFDAKYPSTSKILAVKALTYFNEIDFSVKIELINGQFNWDVIEKRLNEMIIYPNRRFRHLPIENENRRK